MRKLVLILLWSVAAWGEPRWLAVGPEQQRDGRFFFEWGSLRQLPGAVWEKEADTPGDRWHYVTTRGNRVWHMFLLPPGVADPPSTREWFEQLIPETKDYKLVYSAVPHGGSYWMPFTAPDWQGTLVIAHIIPATLAWLDMGPGPTPPEFKEWLRSYQRSDQLLTFQAGRASTPLPNASPSLKVTQAPPKPLSAQQKLQRLSSAFTFWPLFLLVPMALRARKERNRTSYRQQIAILLAFPPACALLLLLLGDHFSKEWFKDPVQRATAFNYLAYRGVGFALLGPLAVLLVRRFRPRRRRKHNEPRR